LQETRRFRDEVTVTIRFGACAVDSATRQLTREGSPVHVSPKAFSLLTTLLDARPSVLTKDELQSILWPDTFVSEANLSNLIAEVRAAIGDTARPARYIRTVHGCGYAFCGATRPARSKSRPKPALTATLAWGRVRLPLEVGEHVIGRDLAADIRLNHSTVSRRHACVMVDSGRRSPLGSRQQERHLSRGPACHDCCRTGGRRRCPDRLFDDDRGDFSTGPNDRHRGWLKGVRVSQCDCGCPARLARSR
jgi:DNA-binding winged helix-turn-helix (wHTH) protein